MAGGDSEMLVFCNSERTVAVVVCNGAGPAPCSSLCMPMVS